MTTDNITNLRALLEQMKKQEPVGTAEITAIRVPNGVGWEEHSLLTLAVSKGKKVKEGDFLYTTPQLPQKEGWQWVPVEATPKMVDATWDEPIGVVESHNSRNKRIYKAMLQAAPKPTEDE